VIVTAEDRPPQSGARQPFIRNMAALQLLDDFVFCAVVSIVAIRLTLSLTGYPCLGGGILWSTSARDTLRTGRMP
jgi:hypothetical protein